MQTLRVKKRKAGICQVSSIAAHREVVLTSRYDRKSMVGRLSSITNWYVS
jgi:hypothetical protein